MRLQRKLENLSLWQRLNSFTMKLWYCTHCTRIYVYCSVQTSFYPWAQILRQGIVMKPVLQPGFQEWGSAVLRISIFLLWNIILFGFFIFSIFFESLKSNYTNVKTPKMKLGSFWLKRFEKNWEYEETK